MNNKYIVSIFGVVILAVTAGFFLLNIPKREVYYWAFSALIFSLLVSLGSILMIYNNKLSRANVFYGASLSTTTFIYLIVVIVSLFFVKKFDENVKSFVFLQMIFNALFLCVVIIISSISNHLHKKAIITSENLKNGEYNKPSRGDF